MSSFPTLSLKVYQIQSQKTKKQKTSTLFKHQGILQNYNVRIDKEKHFSPVLFDVNMKNLLRMRMPCKRARDSPFCCCRACFHLCVHAAEGSLYVCVRVFVGLKQSEFKTFY